MKWSRSSCLRPSKRSSSVALPSGPSKTYFFSMCTRGSLRRSAASASRARVASFSLARSASRAACHSVAETTEGRFIALLSAQSFVFVVSARPTVGIVAAPVRSAVEQLPGRVQDIRAAVVARVRVVDDAVLDRDRAQAVKLVAPEVDLRRVLRCSEVEAGAGLSPLGATSFTA